MKFLATADLHLRDYKTFNEDGSHIQIPSRLLLFRNLANDIAETAQSNNCKFIILAGDILDIHTNTPPVLNVLNEFLSIISKNCHVYLTHGQHDLSTKTVDNNISYLTSLTIFNSDKIHYHHDEIVHINKNGGPSTSPKDVSIYFYGWTSAIPETMPEADIFIGHQMVAGSNDYFGYKFCNGYNPDYLSERYKFSILGDIHCQQIINNNILVPGNPLQNNFKDPLKSGVWVIDNYVPEFIEFTSSVYPKFHLVESENDIPETSPDNHHYKIMSHTSANTLTDSVKASSTLIDLWVLIENLIEPLEDSEILKSLARDYYEEILLETIEGRNLPSVELNSLVIKDFLSIKNYEFIFPNGLTLFTGPIGSGKSTLMEALPYVLFGKTSKSKYKDEISPNFYSGDPKVTLNFSINNNKYSITRGISKLAFSVSGKEVSGNKMSETQQLINEIIGISYEEFSSLIFFAQDTGSFFGRMSEDQQMSLMSLFLGSHTSRVELLNRVVQAQFKAYKEEVVVLEQTLRILNDNKVKYENNLEVLEKDGNDIKLRQRELLVRKGYEVSDAVIDLIIDGQIKEAANMHFNVILDDVINYKDELTLVRTGLVENKYKVESILSKQSYKLKSLKEKETSLTKKIADYKSGVCPECKQVLPTDTSLMESRLQELTSVKEELGKIEDLEVLQDKVSSFNKKISRIDIAMKGALETINKVKMFSACERVSFRKTEEIDLITTMLQDVEVEISDTITKLDDAKTQCKYFTVLNKQVFCDNGLKSKCIESVGFMLSDHVNNLFKEVGLSVTVNIKTVSYRKGGAFDSGFDVSAYFDGVETTYRMASGGQRMLIDLASIISIYNLLSSLYGLEKGVLGLICLDEFVRYLDDENIEAVSDMLEHLVSQTKLLVSHDSKLKQLTSQNVINVSRSKGASKYV